MSRPSTKDPTTPKPGLTIKKALLGEIPLINGKKVEEASINDLHAVYTKLIANWNSSTQTGKKIHGMGTASFYTMFRLAKDLGLVEFVREEALVSPPPHGKLYSIRMDSTGKARAVVSKRRIYRLTSKGKTEDTAWRSLIRAWIKARHKEFPSEHSPLH